MDNSKDILDSLYSRFVLRDLLGRIFPGLILIGMLTGFDYSYANSGILLVLLFAASFVAGILLRGIWSLVWFVVNKFEGKDHLVKLRKFLIMNAERPAILQQRERFVILKDASGNLALSLLLGRFFGGLPRCISDNGYWLVVILLLVMYSYHLYEQKTWVALNSK